jgi:chlorite dismutase
MGNLVKFTFIKVHAAWRGLRDQERLRGKQEVAAACAEFASDHFLRAYSLVGTRGDADLMIRTVCPRLEPLHEFHVLLNQTALMQHAEISHSYLAATRRSAYSDEATPLEPRPGSDRRCLIVYPMVKQRAWYRLPEAERMRIMQEHIALGRAHGSIEINTAYSFGLDDQEFVVSFDTDDPRDFLELVQALRATESSAYTERETPIFTCLSMSTERALAALDGTPIEHPDPASPGPRDLLAQAYHGPHDGDRG